MKKWASEWVFILMPKPFVCWRRKSERGIGTLGVFQVAALFLSYRKFDILKIYNPPGGLWGFFYYDIVLAEQSVDIVYTDPKVWCKNVIQKHDAEMWSKSMMQKCDPKAWCRNAIQKYDAEVYTKVRCRNVIQKHDAEAYTKVRCKNVIQKSDTESQVTENLENFYGGLL